MVLAQYLLTFREVFEAALLAGIVLAFLVKTGRAHLVRYAWWGIYASAGASVVVGIAVWAVYGVLDDSSKVLFEGIAALIAVAVLTSMIYWMAMKGRTLRAEVESRVETAVSQGAVLALFSLTFVLVFREGVETVLFLTPFLGQYPVEQTLVGALLGLAAGLLVAYGIFRIGLKLDLRRFFYFTSLLLILVAGGLLGYGVHELVEYGVVFRKIDLGWWAVPAYDLGLFGGNATSPPDPFHHKGIVGSVLAVMFGYTAKAEWARVVAHLAYLAVALPLIVIVYRRPEWIAAFGSRLRALLRLPAPAAAVGKE